MCTANGPAFKCLFGNVTTAAVVISVNTAVCISPRGQLESVQFCMIFVDDDVKCGMKDLMFEYVEDGRVTGAVPTQGSLEGGTVMSLIGIGCREEALCRVGGHDCRGSQRVSSTLLKCVTPGQQEAAVDVSVEVSNNGAEYFIGDVKFRYTQPWSIVSAHPLRGPDAGKTTVTVIGAGGLPVRKLIFVQVRQRYCKQGTMDVSQHRWVCLCC